MQVDKLHFLLLGLVLSMIVTESNSKTDQGKSKAKKSLPNIPRMNGVPKMYSNPIIDGHYPDPGVFVLDNDEGYVLVSSSYSITKGIPIYYSKNLIDWDFITYALQGGVNWPDWATEHTWSSEMRFINGKYHIFFNNYNPHNDSSRLGILTSKDGPFGLYEDSSGPIDCNLKLCRDPNIFHDPKSQKTYILYLIGMDDSAYITELDTLHLKPKQLMKIPLHSMKPRAGIFLFYKEPYYYMMFTEFFDFFSKKSIQVARSKQLLDGYESWAFNVVENDKAKLDVGINTTFVGPGSTTVIQLANGEWWITYSCRRYDLKPNDNLVVLLDRLLWTEDGWPYVGNPSTSPMPAPRIEE